MPASRRENCQGPCRALPTMTCERYLDYVIVCVTDIQHNDYNYELNAFTHATLHRYRTASSGMHNAGIYNSTERPLDAQLRIYITQ